MPWLAGVLVLAVVLLEIVVVVAVARRVMRYVRSLQDPGQLGRLLTADTRAALRSAGHDPDAIDLDAVRASRELGRLVAPDLRRQLHAALWRRPQAGPVAPVASGPAPPASTASWQAPLASRLPGQPGPAPILPESGWRARLAASLAGSAALVALLYVLFARA